MREPRAEALNIFQLCISGAPEIPCHLLTLFGKSDGFSWKYKVLQREGVFTQEQTDSAKTFLTPCLISHLIFMNLNLNFVRPGGSCQGSLPSQASFIDTRTRTRIRLKYRRVFNSVNMLPIRSTPSLPPDPPPLVSPSPPSPRSLSPSTHSHPASSPIGPSHMATPQRDLSAQRAALQASLAARTLH